MNNNIEIIMNNNIEIIENIAKQSGQMLLEVKAGINNDYLVFLMKTEKKSYDGKNEYVTGLIGNTDAVASLDRNYITWCQGHYILGLDKALADYNSRN